jgi:hypothetical protein
MAKVPADGHQDHVGRPAVAREGRRGPNREVAAAAYAREALATLAVMAITCDDRSLALRGGRHAPNPTSTSQRRRPIEKTHFGAFGGLDSLTVWLTNCWPQRPITPAIGGWSYLTRDILSSRNCLRSPIRFSFMAGFRALHDGVVPSVRVTAGMLRRSSHEIAVNC